MHVKRIGKSFDLDQPQLSEKKTYFMNSRYVCDNLFVGALEVSLRRDACSPQAVLVTYSDIHTSGKQ